MAKTNYQYEKRQKEIAKKKKKEQKLQEKMSRKNEQAKADENAGQPDNEEKQEQQTQRIAPFDKHFSQTRRPPQPTATLRKSTPLLTCS